MDPLNAVARWASEHSALVNMLLTGFLVWLTGWYAVVTSRMWREMLEARLASIRPILDVRADRPQVNEGPRVEERGVDLPPQKRAEISSQVNEGRRVEERSVSAAVQIQNFGRGPAYGLRAEVSLRYENEKERTRIATQLKESLPTSLAPGDRCRCPFTIDCFPTPMGESQREFLTVIVRYQDAEGNYYSLSQDYDLRAFDFELVVSRTWQLRGEQLRFSPVSERRWRRITWLPEEYRMRIIADRVLARYHDWSTGTARRTANEALQRAGKKAPAAERPSR